MTEKTFDESILDMVKADEVRVGLVPGTRKSFYMIDAEWILDPEPWSVRWVDKTRDSVCLIYVQELSEEGEKYVMFLVYDEKDNRVVNYVFEKDKYLYQEEEA